MKRKLKALFLTLLAALCAACLAVAVACQTETPTGPVDPGQSEKPGDDDPPTPPTPPEKETCTVTFDMNGYGVAVAPKSAKEGETVEAPEAPSALFVTFGGWYKDADCTEEFDFDAPLTESVTVYAKWTPTENMPETGYSPDAPTTIVLNGLAIADDIATGTTLYYTFTADKAGRYGFLMASNGNVDKFDFTYEASLSTAADLKENVGTVAGDKNYYLTLKAGETLSISVKVKDGETISVDNPSDVRVSAFEATDEPIPEGMFKEATYTGTYAGYMSVVFKIVDTQTKRFTLNVSDNGVSEGVFTYLDGNGYIAQSWAQQSNWFLGYGRLEWIPAEDEDEPAHIKFVLGMTGTAPIDLEESVEAVNIDRANWIGEYECETDPTQTVRIGQSFVQIVTADDIKAYFIGGTTNSSLTFKATHLELGVSTQMNTLKILKVEDGYAKRVRIAFADGSVLRYTLKSKEVIEVPKGLPLIEGAFYNTEDESERIYTNSQGFTYATGKFVSVLAYDGEKYTVRIEGDNKLYSVKIVYVTNSKAIDKVELYDGNNLVNSYKGPFDVSDNVYDIVSGENSVTVHAQTNYAYLTVTETKCYTFSGNVAVYSGVSLVKPSDEDAWTALKLNTKLNLSAGTVLAVKSLDGSASFTFNAVIQENSGVSESNPIEINGTYTYGTILNGQKVYVRFVALLAGEYTFSSADSASVSYSYDGGLKIYKVSTDGTTEAAEDVTLGQTETGNQAASTKKYTLAAGGYVDFYMYIVNYDSRPNRTVKVAQNLNFGTVTELGDGGTLTANGAYKATTLPTGVTGITFTANGGDITCILTGGAQKTGTTVELAAGEISTTNGVYFMFDGEVTYEYVWTVGYAKNPYKVDTFTSGKSVTNAQGQVYVEFTAPETGSYRLSATGNWSIAQVTDGQAGEANTHLVIELTKGDVITVLLASGDATSTSFMAQFDYSNNAEDVSFTTENGTGEFTVNTNYNITEVTYDVAEIKVTAKAGDITVSFATGEVYTGHEVTVPASVLVVGVCFRVEGGAAEWEINYTEGSLNNPYVIDEPVANFQKLLAAGTAYYVTVTAPENLNLQVYGKRATTSIYSRFQIVGGDGTYYGYSSSAAATTTYAKGYLLAKGQTATFKVDLANASAGGNAAIGIWYNWAAADVTALNPNDAATATLDGAHVYSLPCDAGTVVVKSTAPFEVISVKEYAATATAWYSAASEVEDGYYVTDFTVTPSNYTKFYVHFTGDSTTATYEVYSWAIGSANNPQKLTAMSKLGNTGNVQYKRYYTDGFYYATVTLPLAGSFKLKSNNTAYAIYDLEGNTSNDGIVLNCTAENPTVTFKLKLKTWTEADMTSTTSTNVTVAVTLVSEATVLTFKHGDGVSYADIVQDSVALVKGTPYTIGTTAIVSEDLDKSLTSSPIRIQSDKTFTILYADGTTSVNSLSSGGVYYRDITAANALKHFVIINAQGNITCSVNWASGSYYNPETYSDYVASANLSSNDSTAYVLVKNGTDYDWLFSASNNEGTATVAYFEKWTDAGHEKYTEAQTPTGSIVIPKGETWLLKVFDDPEYDDVAVTVNIVNDFSSGSTVLTLDTESKTVTNTFVSGNLYVLAADADKDIGSVVFSTGAKVTLANGKVITGDNPTLTQTEAKGGFKVEFEGQATATFTWHIDSAKDPKALVLGDNQVVFHAETLSIATYTVTEAGWYTLTLTSTGYRFTVNDSEEWIDRRGEFQFNVGDVITYTIGSTAATPKDGTVSVKFEYSENQKYGGFPAAMLGTWTLVGTVKNYWNWDTSINATLTLGDDFTAQYRLTSPSVTATIELDIMADGSYQGTYSQGSNIRTLTVWFEDGVVYFMDSYNAVGKYAMTKSA